MICSIIYNHILYTLDNYEASGFIAVPSIMATKDKWKEYVNAETSLSTIDDEINRLEWIIGLMKSKKLNNKDEKAKARMIATERLIRECDIRYVDPEKLSLEAKIRQQQLLELTEQLKDEKEIS